MAGLVPAIHVLLFLKSKDVDARDKPGHDEEVGRPGVRHEHPRQQPLSRGPCPLARRPRGLLGRGGARDRLDRAGQKDLRSLDGRVWPLVRRRGGQHLLQRARSPCRERPRRSGGADPRFAAHQHDLEIHLCRDAEGGADARRRDGRISASPRATASSSICRWCRKRCLRCWPARGSARCIRWCSAGLPRKSSRPASRTPSRN